MTREKIAESIQTIRDVMDKKVTIDSPGCILEKLNDLSNVLGLSANLIAQTSKRYNERIGELVLAREYQKLGATEKKLLFSSLAKDEAYDLEYSQQINKDLHYSIEACRSMLSYLKEERKAT